MDFNYRKNPLVNTVGIQANNTDSSVVVQKAQASSSNVTDINVIIAKLKRGDQSGLKDLDALGIKYEVESRVIFMNIKFSYEDQNYTISMPLNLQLGQNRGTGSGIGVGVINAPIVSGTVTTYDEEGNKILTRWSNCKKVSERKYSKDTGRVILEVTYSNGIKIREREFDKNGPISKLTQYYQDGETPARVFLYNSDGTHNKAFGYDKDGNLRSELTYVDNKVNTNKVYNLDGSYKLITYDKSGKIASEEEFDKDGKPVGGNDAANFTGDKETVNSDGTKLVETFENGAKTAETLYDNSGRIVSSAKFENGVKTYLAEYIVINGKLDKETTFNEKGQKTSETNYSYLGDKSTYTEYDPATGNPINKVTYDLNGSIRTKTEYNPDGSYKVYNYYNYSSGCSDKPFDVTEYDKDGKQVDRVLYDYDKSGRIIKENSHDKSYCITYTYDEDGGKTVTKYSTSYEITSSLALQAKYDAEGNLVSEIKYNYPKENQRTTAVYNADGSRTVTIEEKSYYRDYYKIGEQRYDKNGQLRYQAGIDSDSGKTTWYAEYDEKGNKTKEFDGKNTTVYNADGSRTVDDGKKKTVYNADGTKVVYENGDIYEYNASGKLVKKTVNYNDGSTQYVDTYNSDGSSVTAHYDKNGVLEFQIYYDKNHDCIKCICYEYTTDGKLAAEKTKDANGKLLFVVTYEDGKQTGSQQYSYSTTGSYRVNSLDLDGNQISALNCDSVGNKLSLVEYKNGAAVSETFYENNKVSSKAQLDSQGRKSVEEFYNTAGKLLYTIKYTYDGENTTAVKYDANGNKVGESKITTKTYTDANGNSRTDVYVYDEKGKVISKTFTYLSKDGATKYEDVYDDPSNTGRITKRREFDKNGIIKAQYAFTYPEYTDGKNYTRVRTSSTGEKYTQVVVNGVTVKDMTDKTNGDRVTYIYENGKKKQRFVYSKANGTVTTTNYDKNGNSTGTAKSNLNATLKSLNQPTTKSKSIVTLSATDIYNALTSNLYKNVTWGYTGYDLMKEQYGKISADFLTYAQPGYNGTPSGCDKKYGSYKDAGDYAEFIKSDLAKDLAHLGYEPEWVKGYHFSTSSSVSKEIASKEKAAFQKYFKTGDNFNFILGLLKGETPTPDKCPWLTLTSKDLSGSIHGCHIVGAALNGDKLKLTIYDMYDFDQSSQANTIGHAAMEDGKLKPWFMLIEVEINLKDLGLTSAQIAQLKAAK